ncbi:ABC transporter ATP-binding protein [Peribacillus kribbensis]|uniref:ABC transporter ATP-binding protein n=1 Tax=Peribacillus kribbensis TaxID=356658 RepID=UPI00040AF662|nr:ABC transporter ATP-binding protein [Peribacillus kribbensis]
MTSLTAKNLSIGYEERLIVEGLNVSFSKGMITSIIGPNGCGKSTILKTMARLHKAKSGAVYLDGREIHETPTKEIAKKLAVLPQSPEAPAGLTVYELVSYGRTPHQSGFSRLSPHDRKMIDWSLDVTGLSDLKDREVDELSGGQRQRAWIAMAIAQETEILMLDEPTTYLDLAHQLEVLQLLGKINQDEGRTIIMVIHDLNQAARFSHEILALKNGRIISQGTPFDVMKEDIIKGVFGIDTHIIADPRTGKPAMISYDLIK